MYPALRNVTTYFPKAIGVAILGIALMLPAQATKRAAPLDAADWSARWVGYTDGDAFVVLDLQGDAGILAITYDADASPELHSIRRMVKSDYALEIELVPLLPKSEQLLVARVQYFFQHVSLDIRGKTWHQKARLFKSRQLQDQLLATEKAISAARAKPGSQSSP
jgi:hypothetical protein